MFERWGSSSSFVNTNIIIPTNLTLFTRTYLAPGWRLTVILHEGQDHQVTPGLTCSNLSPLLLSLRLHQHEGLSAEVHLLES